MRKKEKIPPTFMSNNVPGKRLNDPVSKWVVVLLSVSVRVCLPTPSPWCWKCPDSDTSKSEKQFIKLGAEQNKKYESNSHDFLSQRAYETTNFSLYFQLDLMCTHINHFHIKK